jgi:c-di-GMP-binding flagellar brake protein YcgR
MSSTHDSSDRRRFVRIRVFEDLQGRVMPLDDAFRVHDISLGGFAVESPLGFMPGSEHQFEFTMPDGRQTVLWATAVHCMRINRTDDEPLYFAGFAFNRLRKGAQQGIENLVNAIAAVTEGS